MIINAANRGGDRQYRSPEARCRRAATRHGLRLVKSRRRDPRAVDYRGYWLVDVSINGIAASSAPAVADRHVQNFAFKTRRPIGQLTLSHPVHRVRLLAGPLEGGDDLWVTIRGNTCR